MGLPSLVGKIKRQVSTTLRRGFGKKIQRWKEKLLSQEGRELLIKTVIQSDPNIHNELLQAPSGLMYGDRKLSQEVLVGTKG